jgi:hypothetical protein
MDESITFHYWLLDAEHKAYASDQAYLGNPDPAKRLWEARDPAYQKAGHVSLGANAAPGEAFLWGQDLHRPFSVGDIITAGAQSWLCMPDSWIPLKPL